MWWCVWFTGRSQSPSPSVVSVRDPGSKAICCPPKILIGPPGAGVVGLLLWQAGGHVAARFPLGFFAPFHMQRMSHYSIWLSPHKTHAALWDNLEFTADTGWARLLYFDISPEELKCKKLLTWISNILVLILPRRYQGPLRLCKTLFHEIME